MSLQLQSEGYVASIPSIDIIPQEVKEYFTKNPFEVSEVCQHTAARPEFYEPFLVTIGDLVASFEEDPLRQRAIQPGNVLRILCGYGLNGKKISGVESPLTETRRVFIPIKVAFNKEGDIVTIAGGRNRFTALLAAYKLSGVDINSDEFLSMGLDVDPLLYTPEIIQMDNKSRTISPAEKVLLKFQITLPEIDISDPGSILDAFYDSKVKLPEALGSMLVVINSDQDQDGNVAGIPGISAIAEKYTAQGLRILSDPSVTLLAVGKAFTTLFKSDYGSAYRTLSKAENRESLDKLVALVVKHIPAAIESLLVTGETNISRNYKSIAGHLVKLVAADPELKLKELSDAGRVRKERVATKKSAPMGAAKAVKASAEAKKAKADTAKPVKPVKAATKSDS